MKSTEKLGRFPLDRESYKFNSRIRLKSSTKIIKRWKATCQLTFKLQFLKGLASKS